MSFVKLEEIDKHLAKNYFWGSIDVLYWENGICIINKEDLVSSNNKNMIQK